MRAGAAGFEPATFGLEAMQYPAMLHAQGNQLPPFDENYA